MANDRVTPEAWRFTHLFGGTAPMSGRDGEIDLDGAGLEPCWPYPWLGQWTHAGKGAVMGLGGYRLAWD